MTTFFQSIKRSFRGLPILALLSLITVTGCRKYLEVPLPINVIAGSAAYGNDNTSGAALNSIYAQLYSSGIFDGTSNVGYLTGLYGDEFRNLSALPSNQALYGDGVSSTLGGVTGIWTNLYKQLYSVNLAIESLAPPVTSLNYRNQWLGEAYFLRGLFYFNLSNLYGDVPLVLTSDYLKNNVLARSTRADVLKQVLSDLRKAQGLLDKAYHDATGAVTTDRGRPNRMAATALLAKVYLYTQDWPNAESQADSLVSDVADYQLTTPVQTFLVNSKEVIWGIVPTQNGLYSYIAKDAVVYYLPAGKAPQLQAVGVCLSDSLVKAFEPGDSRYTNWVGVDSVAASGTTPAAVYYYAHKYQAIGTYTKAQETVVVLRQGEQYLIRAEARAQQNKLTGATGAASDLNAVRARAGLPPTTATTQADLLSAIQNERRIELFSELGNRYFDLRRTGALDALMTDLAPKKGGSWSTLKQWWPIPLTDVQNDSYLVQTPGYL